MWQVHRKLASKLPAALQLEMRRVLYAVQIRLGIFRSPEPDFGELANLVSEGDCVIDIGANIGHYALRLSELVGESGRVFAIEPVPTTFALLAQNLEASQQQNVTLMNVAATDTVMTVAIDIPKASSGLRWFTRARVRPEGAGDLRCIGIPIDVLPFERSVALVKIDVEGYEEHVLVGMRSLIARDHPVLIVETGSAELVRSLESQGYRARRLPGSPNVLLIPS